MEYYLKHFDDVLIHFNVSDDPGDPKVTILEITGEKQYLLPLDLELTENGIYTWLKKRTIPRNRAYVNSLLSKMGLSINRPMGIIRASKGLSLNDCYWITENDFTGTFADYNLYQNNISRILGMIAFTGYGSSLRTSLISSPEFTTNGMLPKCWRRLNGTVQLWKGGTSGASNTGMEPYSEFYATQIAETMGITAIPYRLSMWKGQLCSVCDIFTSIERSFIPVGRIVQSGGMKAVREYYKSLGPSFVDSLNDMLVFDALICNTDRHFGNFGFIVDSRTNQIISAAPLFDHGNALFNFAGKDDFESLDKLRVYAQTLQPCVYDDFLMTAKEAIEHRHHEGLRKLLNFRFKRHVRYNLPKMRLQIIEKIIQERAAFLLN